MLDVLGILISTTAALLVVCRAAKLDELYPLFDDASACEAGPAPGKGSSEAERL
jgi:hypothetical protein